MYLMDPDPLHPYLLQSLKEGSVVPVASRKHGIVPRLPCTDDVFTLQTKRIWQVLSSFYWFTMYVCIYMYVCMYACMHACMYVYIYIFIHTYWPVTVKPLFALQTSSFFKSLDSGALLNHPQDLDPSSRRRWRAQPYPSHWRHVGSFIKLTKKKKVSSSDWIDMDIYIHIYIYIYIYIHMYIWI